MLMVSLTGMGDKMRLIRELAIKVLELYVIGSFFDYGLVYDTVSRTFSYRYLQVIGRGGRVLASNCLRRDC